MFLYRARERLSRFRAPFIRDRTLPVERRMRRAARSEQAAPPRRPGAALDRLLDPQRGHTAANHGPAVSTTVTRAAPIRWRRTGVLCDWIPPTGTVVLGGSVWAARIFRVPGGRLPSDLSHFFVGRLALVRQDAARWLALCARRLRAASQMTSGYMAISTMAWPGPSSGRPGRWPGPVPRCRGRVVAGAAGGRGSRCRRAGPGGWRGWRR